MRWTLITSLVAVITTNFASAAEVKIAPSRHTARIVSSDDTSQSVSLVVNKSVVFELDGSWWGFLA
jgi:hypothetical protein